MELLLTLIGIATSFGIQSILDADAEAAAKRGKVTTDTVLKAVNSLVTQAQAKGSNVLNKVLDKLTNVQMPIGVSGKLQDYIRKTRNNLNTKYRQVRDIVSEADQKLNDIRTRASTFATATDRYKADNPQVKDNLMKEALEQQRLLEGVEKKVNE